jgi:hypothetical protein
MEGKAEQKLTCDLKPGEFIDLIGDKYLVLDVTERKGRVLIDVARVDVEDGRIQMLNVPISWVTVIDHPAVPHLAGLLPG